MAASMFTFVEPVTFVGSTLERATMLPVANRLEMRVAFSADTLFAAFTQFWVSNV